MTQATGLRWPLWTVLLHLPALHLLGMVYSAHALDAYLRSADDGFSDPLILVIAVVLGLVVKRPFTLLIGVVAATLALDGVAAELARQIGLASSPADAARFSVLLTVAYAIHAAVTKLFRTPETLKIAR